MVNDKLKIDGLKFILINKKSKVPIEKWQENNYFYDDERLLKHIQIQKNYGVMCGNGLIVIDADTNKLNEIIKNKFPETFTVKTKSGCHYYYYCINFPKKKVLMDDNNQHLGEIQSTGTYVIAPNSIHPSGIVYTVINDIKIQYIENEFIRKELEKYFSGDVRVNKDLILKGSESGLRNESMFKLSCSFKSKGLSYEETFKTIIGLNKNNKPPLPENEIFTIVKSAYSYKSTKKESSSLKVNFTNLDDRLVLAKEFYKNNPFFYDKNQIFWFWNFEDIKYQIVDDVDMMNMIDDSFDVHTISNKAKGEIIEALKRVGRRNIPKIPPPELVQLKDLIFNIKTKETFKATPEYFFTNPIPYEVGAVPDTPTMDKIFKEWVGEKYVETLYEIIGYCCYRDYPIHLIFCLTGAGRNGKSTFQQLLTKFVGMSNTSSSELDNLISGRFETFKLYKKLICILGETNFGSLKKTSMIKKLVGQDLIGYEMKNKTPFDDMNYAKIIIASNSLPTSYDTSEGFFRRWFIINFPNKFKEGRDIISEIPIIEFNNLAKKITFILPEILKKGEIYNQGSIEKRKLNYIMNSNPLMPFIEEFCDSDVNEYVSYSRLYSKYVDYLKKLNLRIVSKKEFSKVLDEEGIEKGRYTKNDINDTYILGMKLKEDFNVIKQ